MKDVLKSFWVGLKMVLFGLVIVWLLAISVLAFWSIGSSTGWNSIGCFIVGLFTLFLSVTSIWSIGETIRDGLID